MTSKVTVGTVSEGTMNPEHLIPAFASFLEDVSDDYAKLIQEANAIEDYTSEDADYILEELFDALQELAPPYCYFGAHEGDGSDYGYWLSQDALNEAQRTGAPFGDRIITEDGYLLEINDHGNVTVWTIEVGEEILAVV